MSGKLTAGNLISATVIGSRSERLTELFVGDYPFVRQQREELTRTLQQTEKDIDAVQKNIQYLDVGDDVVEDVQKAMSRAQLLAKQRLQKNIFTMKRERLLKQLKELPTLSGKMGFDEKGDRVGDFYRIYKVNNAGKFELQAR